MEKEDAPPREAADGQMYGRPSSLLISLHPSLHPIDTLWLSFHLCIMY